MSEKKTANDYITRFRPELMGLAVLWVLWFHSALSPAIFPWGPVSSGFSFLKTIGYGGVDIFVFMSGFGIGRSLSCNSTSQFAKNRLKKILPIWLSYLAMFVFMVTCFFHIFPTMTEILGNITFTGFWLDMNNQGNWYVYMIVLFYLFSPILYSLIKDSRSKFRMCLILMGIALLVSFAFFGQYKLIAFSRLPLYIFGMYLSMDKQKKSVGPGRILVCLMALLTGTAALYVFYTFYHSLLWTYGLWWYPFILITPALTILLSVLFEKIQMKIGTLLWCLRKMGEASLEIILVSDFFFAYVYPSRAMFYVPKKLRNWLIVILAVVIAMIFHKVLEACKKALGSLSLKKKK